MGVEHAIQWIAAVLSHRPNELDAAVQEIAAWDAPALCDLPVELQSVRRLMRDPGADVFMMPGSVTIPRMIACWSTCARAIERGSAV